jgi:hypothetical protein
MPVTVQTVTGHDSDFSPGNSTSFSHSHSGNDLVVVVCYRDKTGASPPIEVDDVTFPYSSTPTSLTRKVQAQINWVTDNYNTVEIWHTQNADSGSGTVSVTLSEDIDDFDQITVVAYAFNNSDGIGTTTGSATASSADPSVTFTTEDSGGLIVAGLDFHSDQAMTEGTNVTEQHETVASGTRWSGTKPASAGSDTVDLDSSTTSARWAMAAVEVLEESGLAPLSASRTKSDLTGWKQGVRIVG